MRATAHRGGGAKLAAGDRYRGMATLGENPWEICDDAGGGGDAAGPMGDRRCKTTAGAWVHAGCWIWMARCPSGQMPWTEQFCLEASSTQVAAMVAARAWRSW